MITFIYEFYLPSVFTSGEKVQLHTNLVMIYNYTNRCVYLCRRYTTTLTDVFTSADDIQLH